MGASPSRAHKKRLARVPRVQVTALKPGDVLLERIPMHTPHVTRGIDDGVLRGVVATQQGGYFASQERTISGTDMHPALLPTRIQNTHSPSPITSLESCWFYRETP